MTEYHYTTLSEVQKTFYRDIVTAMENEEDRVSSGPLPDKAAFEQTLQAVQFDHPELFYINQMHMAYTTTGDTYQYQINYRYWGRERKQKTAVLEQAVQAIVTEGLAKAGPSPYERCRWLHNYMVRHITYNHEAAAHPQKNHDAYNIEGVFYRNTAVCQGIALAFKLLCDRMGVESAAVTGEAMLSGLQDNQKHAWNLVWLDGACSHVDITWDICCSEDCRRNRYDYFCIPDEEIRMDHTWQGLPVCDRYDLTYFEKKQCHLRNFRHLDQYLDAVLPAHPGVLYFKLRRKGRINEELLDRVMAAVQTKITAYAPRGASYSLGRNDQQLIFFYRIQWKE